MQPFEAPAGLATFCKLWRGKIKKAAEYKRDKFGIVADKAVQYYTGPHDFVYTSGGKEYKGLIRGSEDQGIPPPIFQMTFNKVFELVTLFGPLLYHKNPVRTVTPRKPWKPPDLSRLMQQLATSPLGQQMAQTLPQADPIQAEMHDVIQTAKAELIQQLLNYTPHELGLKEHMRLGIDEALVKGRGVWITELYQPPGSSTSLIRTRFVTVDRLLCDPDMESFEDAKWVAIKHIEPVWQLERRLNLPSGYLKGTYETAETQVAIENTAEGSNGKKQGKTADLICYWEVFSKMGMGVRLRSEQVLEDTIGDASRITEAFGDYVRLLIADSDKVSFPLNFPHQYIEPMLRLPAEMIQQALQPPPPPMQLPDGTMLPPDDPVAAIRPMVQEIRQRLEWPIPFWRDDAWPLTVLDLHPMFNCAWPLNHIEPAMGEQEFLDWAYSSLASKIRVTCRDFVAILKEAGEGIKHTLQHGPDLSVLELEGHLNKSINEVVQWLQHPPVNRDIYTIIEAIERNFEKRTGLSEVIYGQTAHAFRSAEEASLKGQMLQIRPDDMSERVEEAASQIARKEALASRYLLRGEDVLPIFGQAGATFWDQAIASDDFDLLCREFDYRIEAGSARKPNKDSQVQATGEGMQFILPQLQGLWQAFGDPGPLFAFLRDWAKARDLDPDSYIPKPPEQPMQMQQPQQQQQPQQPPQQQPQAA